MPAHADHVMNGLAMEGLEESDYEQYMAHPAIQQQPAKGHPVPNWMTRCYYPGETYGSKFYEDDKLTSAPANIGHYSTNGRPVYATHGHQAQYFSGHPGQGNVIGLQQQQQQQLPPYGPGMIHPTGQHRGQSNMTSQEWPTS